jgi:hypothetical protein
MRAKIRDEVNEIINVEANRRLEGVAKRAESAVNRATVVLGAAAVVGGGVQFAGGRADLRFVVSAWLLASIVFAIIVANFGTGHELPLGAYWNNADIHTRRTLRHRVVEHKLQVLAEDELVVARQANLLRCSYFCFVIALLYALVATTLQL